MRAGLQDGTVQPVVMEHGSQSASPAAADKTAIAVDTHDDSAPTSSYLVVGKCIRTSLDVK